MTAHSTVRDPLRAHHELDKSVVRNHDVGILATALDLFGGLWEAVKLAQWAGGTLAGEPWIDALAVEFVATWQQTKLFTFLKLVQTNCTRVVGDFVQMGEWCRDNNRDR